MHKVTTPKRNTSSMYSTRFTGKVAGSAMKSGTGWVWALEALAFVFSTVACSCNTPTVEVRELFLWHRWAGDSNVHISHLFSSGFVLM